MDTNKKTTAGKGSDLPCGITAEQLKEWKEKYSEVFVISVEKDGKVFSGVFRKPGMKEFSKALKYLTPDPNEPLPKKQTNEEGEDVTPAPTPRDMMRAGMLYYLDCKLAVDKELDEDDEAKAGVYMQLVRKFRAQSATIKNL